MPASSTLLPQQQECSRATFVSFFHDLSPFRLPSDILIPQTEAAVYTGLDGTLGKAGWQWLFIMDGVISLPICAAGYLLYPDFPETTRAFYLNSEDKELAIHRMEKIGRKERTKLGWSVVKRVFGRWHVYALTVLYIIFINTGPSSSVNPFSLWLKATGWDVAQIVSDFFMRSSACSTEWHTNMFSPPTRILSQQPNTQSSSSPRSRCPSSPTSSANAP